MRSLSRTALALTLVVLMTALPPMLPLLNATMVAWAQDDDGGDDGDDGDGDGDDGDDGDDDGDDGDDDDDDGDDGTRSDRSLQRDRASGRTIRRDPVRQAVRQVRPAAPPPLAAADEIVTLGLAEADLAALLALGFAVLEEVPIPALATVSRRLRIPPGATLEAARQEVRVLPSGRDADFNHYYRSEQGFPEDCRGAECLARTLIDWPRLPGRDSACGRTVAIGMIDTGINADHPAFQGARMDVHRLGAAETDPSDAIHGTAVAALLVGDPVTRSPGLVPGSRLVAVDAFHRSGADERADVFTLIEGLGFLTNEGVGVINLSLAGPDNGVLAEAIRRLVLERDIVIVSAVGNDGPNAEPAYPAAYAEVIAVTAVDRAGVVYRRAVQGDHVDLAAPGVNVWTAASISGARQKTGTSFAVPFVTAAAAILREAQPDLGASDIQAELGRRATDLGDVGPDRAYGAGLLNIGAICANRT